LQRGDAEPRTWQQAAATFYGFTAESGPFLSGHESYGTFVGDWGFFPTEAEFALYLRHKWVSSGKKRTLPHLLDQFISEIFESVDPVRASIDAREFARLFEASRPCSVRKCMEAEYMGADARRAVFGASPPST
jgi:hypothetical protein